MPTICQLLIYWKYSCESDKTACTPFKYCMVGETENNK